MRAHGSCALSLRCSNKGSRPRLVVAARQSSAQARVGGAARTKQSPTYKLSATFEICSIWYEQSRAVAADAPTQARVKDRERETLLTCRQQHESRKFNNSAVSPSEVVVCTSISGGSVCVRLLVAVLIRHLRVLIEAKQVDAILSAESPVRCPKRDITFTV